MIFTTNFTISPAHLTFELAQQLTDLAGRYDAKIVFDGYSGAGTMTAEPPVHYELLHELENAHAILTGMTDGHRSFNDFFGKKVPLTYDRAQVYTNMCLGGKIW